MSPWWLKPTEARTSISPRQLLASSLGVTLALVINLGIAVFYFAKGEVWLGALFLGMAVCLALLVGVVMVEMRKGRHANRPRLL